MNVEIKHLVIDYRAREWCKLPYPDHPNGCPNYNHRPNCPPNIPKIEDWRIDLCSPIYFITVSFNVADHIYRMKSLHPDWSERQAKCVLYWQGKVNKDLNHQSKLFCFTHPGTIYTTCPEAMGIDVIHTAKKAGIPIHSRPKDIVYKIALVGYEAKKE